eukprot:555577_1
MGCCESRQRKYYENERYIVLSTDMKKSEILSTPMIVSNELLVHSFIRTIYTQNNFNISLDIIHIIQTYLKLSTRVYAAGANSNGHFGIGKLKRSRHLTLINDLNNKSIINIYNGYYAFTIYKSDTNDLYVAGNIGIGKGAAGVMGCGLLKTNKSICDIMQLKSMEQISEIYVSHNGNHGFYELDTDDTNIYGFAETSIAIGYNTDDVQAGRRHVLLADRISIPFLSMHKQDYNIKMIKCGHHFSIVLLKTGQVFSVGIGGGHGATGLGTWTNEWTQIDSLKEVKIIDIECGYSNSSFLSEHKEVYVCGNNSYGQLGFGNTDSYCNEQPLRVEYFVENDVKIQKMLFGRDYCLVLDMNGNVYSCGHNQHGYLGHGHTDDVVNLKKINIELHTQSVENKIIDIKIGYTHCCIVTKLNEYYMFGQSGWGQCLHPSNYKVLSPYYINDNVAKLTNNGTIIDIFLAQSSTELIVS